MANKAEGQLPQKLQDDEECRVNPGVRFNDPGSEVEDPYTGVPYRYERLSPFMFKFCAQIERPEVRIFADFENSWACQTSNFRHIPPRKDG